MKKIFKVGESALKGIKQATIDMWNKGVEDLITKAEQEKKELDAIMESIVPKRVEAYNKGVGTRELAELTNGEISHATIARYIQLYAKKHPELTIRKGHGRPKKAKEQSALPEASDYIKEAKELKESTEHPQHA
jgi:response regulator of citrate/malate metabolism